MLITGTYLDLFFHPSEQQIIYHGSYVKLDGVPMSEACASTLDISRGPSGSTQMCNCTLDVTVTDSAKPEGQAYDSLPIEITTSSAPSQGGTLAVSNGLSVTDTLGDQLYIGANASGGTGPYTWTVTGLPTGVTARAGGYNNAAFSLGGAATAAGTYPFTVTLSDSSQPRQTVTGHYTLTVRQG